MSSIPIPPATAFTHYYRECETKTRAECLHNMAELQVPTEVDARSISLPIGFATVVDALGELTPCSEETAKKCQAFLEHRKVPRHKIPKVGMRADGKFAIRAAAAREAALLKVEMVLLQDPDSIKELNTQTRKTAVINWDEGVKIKSDKSQEMINKEKKDIGRYHDAMHQYYKKNHCPCATKKQCDGMLCICKCYFCSVDRNHAMSGNRCECSRRHRHNTRWQGSIQRKTKETKETKETQESSTNRMKKEDDGSLLQSVHYKTQPELLCGCEKNKKCAVHGCDCFCGYCIRAKALFVQRTAKNDAVYCPCATVEICQDSRTCFCRCYKCSCEKTLMGLCPFRPPQVV